MAEVTINYKDTAIATMDVSGTKTLQTQGKYCEDDIEVVYARPSGGGSVPIESGVFTVATKTKTYDINHSLGVVPNFAFIYPIDVHSEADTYLIGSQVLCGNFGQTNWTTGTNATVRGANHAFGVGTGYAVSVHSIVGLGDNLPDENIYAGLFTNEFVRVGGVSGTGSGGWLHGTYGYFVGVMPIETSGA